MFHRSEGFSVGQYKDLDSFQKAVDRELDNITDGLRKLEKQFVGATEESGKTLEPPPTPVLSEGTNTTGGNWDHEQGGTGLLYGTEYWLYQNIPYSKEGSNDSLPKITIRVWHGAEGKLTSFLLEQDVICLIALTVRKAIPAVPGTYEDPIGMVFTQQVTEVDAANGYTDFYLYDPRIDINDRCAVVIVAFASGGGTTETAYGEHDRDFTAGTGIPIPEALTWVKRKRKPNHIKIKLKFLNNYKTQAPYTDCCNHYDRIEMWTADNDKDDENEDKWDGVSTNPDATGATGWELQDTIDIKRKIKKIKKLTEDGASQTAIDKHKIIKVKIPVEEGEVHREAFRIVDDLGQKGPWEASNPTEPQVSPKKYYYAMSNDASGTTVYIIVYDPSTGTWSKIEIENLISGFASTGKLKNIWYAQDKLYLMIGKSDGYKYIYYSADEGVTWTEITNTTGYKLQAAASNPYSISVLNKEYMLVWSQVINNASQIFLLNLATATIERPASRFNQVHFGGAIYPIIEDVYNPKRIYAVSHGKYTYGVSDITNYNGEILIISDLETYRDVQGYISESGGVYTLNITSGGGITADEVNCPISLLSGTDPNPDAIDYGVINDTSGNLRTDGYTIGSAGDPKPFRIFSGVKMLAIDSSAITDSGGIGNAHKGISLRDGNLIVWYPSSVMAIYKYTLSTNTWSKIKNTQDVKIIDMTQDATNDNLLYASAMCQNSTGKKIGMRYSTDQGANWTECTGTETLTTTSMASNILQDGEGYTAAFYLKETTKEPVVKMDDGTHTLTESTCNLTGITWTAYDDNLDAVYPFKFAIKPKTTGDNPDVPQDKNPIYLLCRNLTAGASEKRRIYRTRDNGHSFDKIWGDSTDNEMPRTCLQVEHRNKDYTRVYRLAGDGVGFSAKYSTADFVWYDFFTTKDTFKELVLANSDTCAYLCDNANIWRTLDRTLNTITWEKIWDYESTATTKIEHIAIDYDTDELFATSRDGKLYYCMNPYSAATWDSGVATGFGTDEIIQVIATLTYIYIFGNNTSFKIRRVEKSKVTGGTVTSGDFETVSAPTGIGTLEQNNVYIDEADENFCLIMSRNSTAGLWASHDFAVDTSPTWSSELTSNSLMRCACKVASLPNTYLAAGNSAIYLVAWNGSEWTATVPEGASEILTGTTFNFVAVGTPRTYFPSGGGSI